MVVVSVGRECTVGLFSWTHAHALPNMPMKLTIVFGASGLSAGSYEV
jgi:hypothetical protein